MPSPRSWRSPRPTARDSPTASATAIPWSAALVAWPPSHRAPRVSVSRIGWPRPGWPVTSPLMGSSTPARTARPRPCRAGGASRRSSWSRLTGRQPSAQSKRCSARLRRSSRPARPGQRRRPRQRLQAKPSEGQGHRGPGEDHEEHGADPGRPAQHPPEAETGALGHHPSGSDSDAQPQVQGQHEPVARPRAQVSTHIDRATHGEDRDPGHEDEQTLCEPLRGEGGSAGVWPGER